MKAKAGAEAQRPRNRRSEPQFDGVVACGDLALQPFQAGERVGSGPVLIGSPWGDQVGAHVQVLLWSRGGTIRICRLRSAEVSDTGSAPPIFSRQMRVYRTAMTASERG